MRVWQFAHFVLQKWPNQSLRYGIKANAHLWPIDPIKVIRHMKELYKEQLIKKILHIVEEEVREELKNENPETLYILGGIQMQITIGKAEERQKDERELHQNTLKVLKELISKINSINKNQ